MEAGQDTFPNLPQRLIGLGEDMSYKEAARQVKSTSIFTTHTPVPAGHDVFPFPLMEEYFALRMFNYRNAVSKRHGEVTRKMWHCLRPELPEEKVPIDYVTMVYTSLYYNVSDNGIPHDWVNVMKESIRSNAPSFSARQMVKEYIQKIHGKYLHQKAIVLVLYNVRNIE